MFLCRKSRSAELDPVIPVFSQSFFFFFLMPKYVTIPLLHSGLTETIQKYSWACWMCADAGVGSETLGAVTSY